MNADLQMLPSGTRVDRYEIGEPLGRGGFSTVYTATHAHLGHPVALKLLHSTLAGSSEMVERFFREARAAAAVGNPHIVDVNDCGHAPDGQPFLAMELLEGIALEDLLEESGGTLPLERAVDIALQTLDGLQSAHAAGIIHRDLKPANIFITRRDGGEEDFVKILDFGISKIRSESLEVALTKTGALLGTPLFMAPEQFINSRDADHRVDIYALSAVVYLMLSGRHPFEAGTLGEIAHRVTSRPLVPLKSLASHIPTSLCMVVERGLAKDPDARWGSSRALTMALEQLLDSTHAALPPGSVDDRALLETQAASGESALSHRPAQTTPNTRPEAGEREAVDPAGRGAGLERSTPGNEPKAGSIEGDQERRRWPLVLATALVVLMFFGVTMVVGFLIGSQRVRRQDEPTAPAPAVVQAPQPIPSDGTALSLPAPSTTTPQPQAVQVTPSSAPSGWPPPAPEQASPAPILAPQPQLPPGTPQTGNSGQPPLGTVTIVSTQAIGSIDTLSVTDLLGRARSSMERCRVRGQNITVRAQLLINPPEAAGRRIAIAQASHEETSHRDAARCCALAAREVAGRTWQPEGDGIANFEVALRGR